MKYSIKEQVFIAFEKVAKKIKGNPSLQEVANVVRVHKETVRQHMIQLAKDGVVGRDKKKTIRQYFIK